MKAFSAIPFLRILIPFVSGIAAALCFEITSLNLIYFLALLSVLLFCGTSPKHKAPLKFLFLFCADLFFFLYGIELVNNRNLSRQHEYYGNNISAGTPLHMIAVVSSIPVDKEKTVKCRLQLVAVKENGQYRRYAGNLIGYFKKPDTKAQLKAGNTLLIRAKLSEPESPKNPGEFDYKAYLFNRQIYHTLFIENSAYTAIDVNERLDPVWELGLTCKSAVLARLKNSALSENAYSICSALLTGYDADIDQSIMQAFSHTGTLHVLSVSGLHTGLIYLVLNFLFDFFDRDRKRKLLRFLFITTVLWFFALVAGFAAPVLRAVIMFNLFGLGRIYFRSDYRNQLNILFVSAFIMLSYNPYFITEVGFLLSYSALFGLIYFQPALTQIFKPQNALLKYSWQSVTASFSATISTLPITLLCFKQFPIWFFVCNLVVVPLTFVVLLLAVFVVFKINFMAIVINYLISFMIKFINLFDSDKFGFIERIHFNLIDAIVLSILTLLLSAAFQQRSRRQLAWGLGLLIAWQFISLFDSYASKSASLFTVYSIKKGSAFSVKNKVQAHLAVDDTAQFNYHIKPHMISFNYPEITKRHFNYFKKENNSWLILDQPGHWPDIDLEKVTALVIANNFKISEFDLKRFQSLKILVADASNNKVAVARVKNLSGKFGMAFHSTGMEGAYLAPLQ